MNRNKNCNINDRFISEKYITIDPRTIANVNDGTALDATIPGGRLNKKDGLTRYGNSHVKDKTS